MTTFLKSPSSPFFEAVRSPKRCFYGSLRSYTILNERDNCYLVDDFKAVD